MVILVHDHVMINLNNDASNDTNNDHEHVYIHDNR